jgi:hypothetical protein
MIADAGENNMFVTEIGFEIEKKIDPPGKKEDHLISNQSLEH